MEYKALRKNPSSPQADSAVLAALRDLPTAALSDNMHRNIGTSGLHPYHLAAKQSMAGTAVTARSRGGDEWADVRVDGQVLGARRQLRSLTSTAAFVVESLLVNIVAVARFACCTCAFPCDRLSPKNSDDRIRACHGGH